MENQILDMVSDQNLEELPNMEPDAGEMQKPEEEQQDEADPDPQPESSQETMQTRSGPPPLAVIEFRIQQLQNRRFLLQKMREFTKKSEQKMDSAPKQTNIEDDDDSEDELETIQKELNVLLLKKEELSKEEETATPTENGVHQADPSFYKNETPWGGIYTLPPAEVTQEESIEPEDPEDPEEPVEPVETEPEIPIETPEDDIAPVETLCRDAGLTQCPTCKELIITQTQRKVGETTWLACCLCSMLGCVGGCCIIPFCMKNFKDVLHQCPHCQSTIHTFKPF
nr:lipopolysaccharide-induced tumor necrosis factor-alpha factor [Maylandia zebra]